MLTRLRERKAPDGREDDTSPAGTDGTAAHEGEGARDDQHNTVTTTPDVGHADATRDAHDDAVSPPRYSDPTDVRDDSVRKNVDDDAVRLQDEVEATPVLRIPSFSAIAPIAGWLAAWGAAALALAALVEAGVGIGFGFGIADGSIDADSGFWAGLWMLVVLAGAFLLGGYVAGRMARTRALAHAALAWFVAMAATAADAIIVAAGEGRSSVLARLRLPQWAGLDYDQAVILPMVIFAVGALVAAIVGGSLAAGANRLETTHPNNTASRRNGRAGRERDI